jgi:hypothetical protein
MELTGTENHVFGTTISNPTMLDIEDSSLLFIRKSKYILCIEEKPPIVRDIQKNRKSSSIGWTQCFVTGAGSTTKDERRLDSAMTWTLDV